jgi:cysteine synthase
MKYYNSYKDLIGNTPIVKLSNLNFPENINLFGKLELCNPGGTLKDRIAKAIIEDAERSGKLKKGGTIVEATSGGTGIGLALYAVNKGYKLIIVMPTKFSQEKQEIIKILGAEIINTPKDLNMQGAFNKIEEILKEIPDAFYVDQFSNPSNPKIHFETTGPEIYNDMEGKIDYFVAGAGSGGCISGAGKYLKSKIDNLKIIMADPLGSTMGGGDCHFYAIEGIGNSFMPKVMDMSVVDEVYKISDEEAFTEVKLLARTEGILAGSSSGATLSAARKLSEKIKEPANIVVILADRGDRYLSEGFLQLKNGGKLKTNEETENKHVVKSFNLDHTSVTAPFIRLADEMVSPKGDIITKLDSITHLQMLASSVLNRTYFHWTLYRLSY